VRCRSLDKRSQPLSTSEMPKREDLVEEKALKKKLTFEEEPTAVPKLYTGG